MKTIAIIGASGYVGQNLLSYLSQFDYILTGITRTKDIYESKTEGVNYRTFEQCDEQFDIIINTTYSLNKNVQAIFMDNVNMANFIKKISYPESHVIHLSSLAVFGFNLDIPIHLGPLKMRKDFNYVKSKLHMEELISSTFLPSHFSILRLGNIWGPANNSWTQPIADAIQWQLPVMPNAANYSNVTFIDNLVHYIHFVISSPNHKAYHHVAEFSDINWNVFIASIENRLNKKALPIIQSPSYPTNALDEWKLILNAGLMAGISIYRAGRFTSPVLLKWIEKMRPIWQWNRTYKPVFRDYQSDPVFYWVLNCSTQFKEAVLPNWEKPYSIEDCHQRVCQWLKDSGYCD